MKRPIASPPDSFSVHPLLAILPRHGSLNKLENLQSSLFARYETVASARAGADAESQRKLQSEEAMLRAVLDWIQASEGEAR